MAPHLPSETVADPSPPFPFGAPDDPLGLTARHAALSPRRMARVRLPEGQADTHAWLALGHAEALQVYRDDADFVRAPADGVKPFLAAPGVIISLDHEAHRRIRGLLQPAFTPAAVASLRGDVEQIAVDLAEEMRAGRAAGRAPDLVEDFALALTLRTIAAQFDIPEADRGAFRRWNAMLVSVGPTAHRDGAVAMAEMVEYMAGLVAARAADPGEDLVSKVAVGARATGVGDAEAALLAASVVTGGWESTGGQLASMLYLLLTADGADGRPRYRDLVERPAAIGPAVEETLRLVPNSVLAATQPRRATRDVRVGATLVRAGELVIPCPDTANRDPRVFDDPERFDLDRGRTRHLAFGSGPHACIGAPLARIELRAALETLTYRFPGLRLAVPAGRVEWRWDGGMIRRPVALPATW